MVNFSKDNGGGNVPEHMFEIYVNNQPIMTQDHEMIAAALKTLAGIPQDYALYVVEGNDSRPVGNDEVVHIHEDMRFRAIPSAMMGCYLCRRQD